MAPIEFNDGGLADFTEYFVKNYPGPRTLISDPRWHAPKIFRAAQRAIKSAATPPAGERLVESTITILSEPLPVVGFLKPLGPTDPHGCLKCKHKECGRFLSAGRTWQCRAWADDACAMDARA